MATTLYYNEFSCPSRKVLIALFEKKVTFERHQLNLREGQQMERWYLDINPRGEVPTLKHGDQVVTDSSNILEFVDCNFGRPHLYPVDAQDKIRALIAKIDSINMSVLMYGTVCFQTASVTKTLRHPFSTYDIEDRRRRILQRPMEYRLASEKHKGTASEAIFEEKACNMESHLATMTDRKLFMSFLAKVESILDEVEGVLSQENRIGPWMFGPTFSAADITLTALLVRLHQLGLDDEYWNGGRRPHLAVYSELAFRRPSVEKATEWRERAKQVIKVGGGNNSWEERNGDNGGNNGLDAAAVGLGAVLLLGGIYACKKLFRR